MPETLSIPADLREGWQRLVAVLAGYDSLLVAFSGGADSSLLLAAAIHALGPAVKAGLCTGPFTPPWEAEAARHLAAHLGADLLEIDCAELADPAIQANDGERCYLCKRRRMELLLEQAGRLGIAVVAEGSQLDDAQGHRPGARAVAELGIASPLAQAGLGKAQVRALGRALGLATAEAPSGACLATRIPTGAPLFAQALSRVARAEARVRALLPGQVRVRDEFPCARLELDEGGRAKAQDPIMAERLDEVLRHAGYTDFTIDPQGYRPSGGGPIED